MHQSREPQKYDSLTHSVDKLKARDGSASKNHLWQATHRQWKLKFSFRLSLRSSLVSVTSSLWVVVLMITRSILVMMFCFLILYNHSCSLSNKASHWDFILSNYLLFILVSEVSLYEREQAHQKPVVERHLVSLLNCLDRPHLQRYTFSHINQPPLLLVDLHSRNVPH